MQHSMHERILYIRAGMTACYHSKNQASCDSIFTNVIIEADGDIYRNN